MYEYRLKEIINIYDGDTMIVILDLGFGITKIEKLRLAFIDAPELRGEEHDDGIESRDWLREEMRFAMDNDEEIIIKTFKDHKGKYGRYIAEIFIDGISLNKRMIDEGYAVAY